MRQVVSFVVAAAMLTFGGYSLYFQLVVAPGWRGILVLGAAFLFIAGGMWLIGDFVLLILRGKQRD